MIALRSLMHIKLDLLPGFQRSVAIHLDGRVVREDILAATDWTDKAEAFGIIEPFNSTRLHASTSLARQSNELGDEAYSL